VCGCTETVASIGPVVVKPTTKFDYELAAKPQIKAMAGVREQMRAGRAQMLKAWEESRSRVAAAMAAAAPAPAPASLDTTTASSDTNEASSSSSSAAATARAEFSLKSWLKELALEQYCGEFESNGFEDHDRELVAEITNDDLVAMGIKLLAHRKKILLNAAKLK